MSANSNTSNAEHLSDSELELVIGGAAAFTELNPTLLKAAEQLSGIYQANHPIHLGSFPPPHVAVPH